MDGRSRSQQLMKNQDFQQAFDTIHQTLSSIGGPERVFYARKSRQLLAWKRYAPGPPDITCLVDRVQRGVFSAA